MTKKTLSLSISKLSFESSEDRTNWMTFKGTCMFVDKPSDYIPSGGIDKPTFFPRADTQTALPTFANMGVNCRYSEWDSGQLFEGHDNQFKIGIVKTAEIVGNEVVISGGLWSYDFCELCDKVKSAKESLGWSIEVLMILTDKGDYYEATNIEFIGVALMWADKAAFKQTCMLAQRKNSEKDGLLSMNKEELQAMLAEFSVGINKAINDNIEGVKLEFSAQIAEVTKVASDGFAKIDAEKAEEKEQLALAAEEKAKADLEAKALKDVEDAEKAKLALEAQQAEEAAKAQRQTMMFGGAHIAKFEGDTNAAKEVMANASLSPQEQFRALIDLKLAAAK